MKRTATIAGILFETDAPEIITARDAVGTTYLGLLVEYEQGHERFVCVPVSPQRLADVRFGRVDLRHAFENSELGDVFVGEHFAAEAERMLNLFPMESIPPKWLPMAGFPLADFLPEFDRDDRALETLAIVKQASVGVFELHPPESYPDSKINSYNLAEGIRLFQNLVKHAYNKALSSVEKGTKMLLGAEDGYVLQVLPEFSPGSFKVHFQSRAAIVDLSGTTGVGLALAKIDEITQWVDNAALSLDVLRNNQGHVITAYKALLRFVAEQKIPVAYQWSEPGKPKPRARRISISSAENLYALLVATKELSRQEVVLVGRFERLDTPRWALRTAEGKRVTGALAEGAEEALKSIVYETGVYRVVCDERLDESVGFGKQDTALFIKEVPTLLPTIVL